MKRSIILTLTMAVLIYGCGSNVEKKNENKQQVISNQSSHQNQTYNSDLDKFIGKWVFIYHVDGYVNTRSYTFGTFDNGHLVGNDIEGELVMLRWDDDYQQYLLLDEAGPYDRFYMFDYHESTDSISGCYYQYDEDNEEFPFSDCYSMEGNRINNQYSGGLAKTIYYEEQKEQGIFSDSEKINLIKDLKGE